MANDAIPPCLAEAGLEGLSSFIKSTHEITQIRRVLRSHLGTIATCPTGIPQEGQCALTDVDWLLKPLGTQQGDSSDTISRYLQHAHAHRDAQLRYQTARSQRHGRHKPQHVEAVQSLPDSGPQHRSFLELLEYKRCHGRLAIMERSLDQLQQTEPAGFQFGLDPKDVAGVEETPPIVPLEVFAHTPGSGDNDKLELEHLVAELERSVLRAKMQLKAEQKLLLAVQSHGREDAHVASPALHLEALERTRNELILWIESELATSPEEQSATALPSSEGDRVTSGDIDTMLASVEEKYSRYCESYHRLRSDVGRTCTASQMPALDRLGKLELDHGGETAAPATSIDIVPHLQQLTALSRDQKAANLQKSYLTATLARRSREIAGHLNRLSQKSQLILTSNSNGDAHALRSAPSEGDLTLGQDKIELHRMVQAWSTASKSASIELKGSVTERLVEGEEAVGNARNHLYITQSLIDPSGEDDRKSDIWSVIDGQLGMLNR